MKKIVALALATLMTLTALSGLSFAFAEDVSAGGVTLEYDFSQYVEDTGSTFGLVYKGGNVSNVKKLTKGYMQVRVDADPATKGYPHFTLGNLPTCDASVMDVVLIKYKTSVACDGEFYMGLSDGTEAHAQWTYNANGQWNIELIDASEIWGNAAAGTTIETLRFDPMEGGRTVKNSEICIEYIKFFADVETAEEYQVKDSVLTGSVGVLPADEVLQDGDTYYTAEPLVSVSKVGAVYKFSSSTYFLQVGDRVFVPSKTVEGWEPGNPEMYFDINAEGKDVLVNAGKETPVTRVTSLYKGNDGNLYTEGESNSGAYGICQYAGTFTRLTKAADVTVPAVEEIYAKASATGSVKVYCAIAEKEEGILFEVNGRVNEVIAAGKLDMAAADVAAFGYAIDDYAPVFDDTFADISDEGVRCYIAASTGRVDDGVHVIRFLVKMADGTICEIPDTRTVLVAGDAVEKEIVSYSAYPVDYTFEGGRAYIRGEKFAVTVETLDDGSTIAYYDTRAYKAKVPTAPVEPGTEFAPVVLIDGGLMMGATNDCTVGQYDRDNEFVTLTATGADPYYTLITKPTTVAQYLAICYRTTAENCYGEIYAGSYADEVQGVIDGGRFEYIADGEWHVAVIDLSDLSDAYNGRTNVINYFRHDILAADKDGAGVTAGASVDISYYGFFETKQQAAQYEYVASTVYYVNFLNEDGSVYWKAAYNAGTTSVVAPEVPAKEGYTGEWESYTLADADVNVKPVYTFVGVETTAPADTGAEENTTAAAAQTSGCKSVIASASVFGVVALAAGVVICRKGKKNENE